MRAVEGGLITDPVGLAVRLLGPVKLGRDGAEASLSPKVQQVLAVLALRPGALVMQETLIAELWPEGPPRSATTTMQTYIYQLRQALEALDRTCDAAAIVRTEPPGYSLDENAVDIDVVRFRELVTRARLSLTSSAEDALSTGRHALRMIRGAPLAGVKHGQILRGSVARLEEEVATTCELVTEAQLELQRYGEVVVELYELCAKYPLREPFHYQLMTALTRLGRRCEALEVYGRLMLVLREELGIDPSEKFQRLHIQILNGTAHDPQARRHRLAE